MCQWMCVCVCCEWERGVSWCVSVDVYVCVCVRTEKGMRSEERVT